MIEKSLVKERVEFSFDPDMMAYYFILNGKQRTIRGIWDNEYKTKHSPGRNRTAAVIRILRKNNFLFTDLEGKMDMYPAEFFSQLIADGYKIRQVTYDSIELSKKADVKFSDIYGCADYRKEYRSKSFHFRIYNVSEYLKALDALQPLLKGLSKPSHYNGIITQREEP